jgi:deoxyribodipyrimidine photo-lyase
VEDQTKPEAFYRAYLYHKEDLPFPIKDIPDSFATFRKKIERDSSVRQIAPAPTH